VGLGAGLPLSYFLIGFLPFAGDIFFFFSFLFWWGSGGPDKHYNNIMFWPGEFLFTIYPGMI